MVVMIPENILNALECSLVSDNHKHIIRNAITMPCGHSACKSCILNHDNNNNSNNIKCLICNQINEIDLNNFDESFVLKCTFKTYIEELFKILLEKMNNSMKQLKSEVFSFETRLDEHIDYLQDEIEIKIGSIKIELDEINESFKNELNEVKTKLKQYYQINYNIHEIDLEKFKNKLDRRKDLNENLFYDYQAKIENLNKIIDELKTTETKMSFEESSKKIDKSIIGCLNLNFLNFPHRGLIDRIETLKPMQMYIGQSPCALLTLTDELLLLVFNNKLELYNSNLELIDYSYKAYNQLLNCCAATTNRIDKIYLCEYNSHSIKILDFKFEDYIHRVSSSDINDTKLLLNYPRDIFFYRNSLYICDLRNRITRLSSENLSFENEYKIDFQAKQIKISNEIACLNTYDYDLIIFCELTNFHILRKYDRRHGPICELNANIYEFDKNGEKMFCYDSDGTLSMELKTRFNHVSFENYLGIVYHNGKIIISTSCGKLLFL